jgi:hypothetical protein
MKNDLYILADQVHDEESLLSFIEAMATDLENENKIEQTSPSSPYGPGELGWENKTIGAFLDAAIAWGSATSVDSNTYKKPNNPYCRIAHILHAGKFYE